MLRVKYIHLASGQRNNDNVEFYRIILKISHKYHIIVSIYIAWTTSAYLQHIKTP